MKTENINQITDIYIGLDLYDSIDLRELISTRLDIPEIHKIANERVPVNLFAATGDKEDYSKRILCNFIEYLKNPIGLNIDCYCTSCKKEYAFNYTKDYLLIPEEYKNYNSFEGYLHKDIFFVTFLCSKCHSQEISFLFRLDEEFDLYKIGQNPSKIDLIINEEKRYRGLLGEKYYQELKESMILNSHGFSIGAFVYLRRIFEYIIQETYTENKSSLSISDEDFLRSKMDQKIEILKDYLPKFLVAHKFIYGILSKHIHELDKEECSKNYLVIKGGIELILDERIKLIEEKRKEEELSKGIGRIASNI